MLRKLIAETSAILGMTPLKQCTNAASRENMSCVRAGIELEDGCETVYVEITGARDRAGTLRDYVSYQLSKRGFPSIEVRTVDE